MYPFWYSDLQRDINNKVDKYEFFTLRGDVDGLERSFREISAVCDGLRAELMAAQDQIRRLMEERDEA